MHGIFLHVLADTLGSLAVIVSTLLAQYTGWMGWDPVASVLVAVMIFISAIPLTTTCAARLMMVLDDEFEWKCKDALHGVAELRGVVGYAAVRFWVVDVPAAHDSHVAHHHHHHHGHEHSHCDAESKGGRKICGVMHVFAALGSNLDDVRERTEQFLKGRGLDVVVQVERESASGCECRIGK